MFVTKRIMCTLCLKYGPDCSLNNKPEILNIVSAVTAVEFLCDFTFHVCTKCLINLKLAYEIQQKFVKAIQVFVSLPEHSKVEHAQIRSNLSDLSPDKHCLICQQVVLADNVGPHLKQHFESKLTCDICNITVANIRDYKTHCKFAKHAKVNFFCLECNATFAYKSLYNIHTREHEKSDINFERNVCAEKLNHKVEKENICIQQPIIKSNVGKVKKVKTCDLKKIKTHKRSEMKETEIDEPEKETNIVCVDCNATFRQKTIYMFHLQQHVDKGDIDENLMELIRIELYGSKPTETECKMEKSENKNSDNEVTDIIEDPNIDNESNEKVALVDVKVDECPERSVTCDHCQLNFAAELFPVHPCYSLENCLKDEHLECNSDTEPKDESRKTIWDIMNADIPRERILSTEKVKCQDCPIVMDLNYHRCRNRKLLCEYCGLVLPARYSSFHFLNKHSNQKNYKCNICGLVCKTSKHVARHRVLHHGPKKKFVCSYCGKNFPRSATMRVHERQHTHEAPYKCKICGEAFKQNVLLRRHRSSIHKLFETPVCVCDTCGKEFSSHIALESHTHRVHSGTENKGQS